MEKVSAADQSAGLLVDQEIRQTDKTASVCRENYDFAIFDSLRHKNA